MRKEDYLLLKGLKNTNEIMTLIFSAKESLYKCLNPVSSTFFGFEHAYVSSLDFDQKTFQIVLDSDIDSLKGYNKKYTGYFEYLEDSIITSVPLV